MCTEHNGQQRHNNNNRMIGYNAELLKGKRFEPLSGFYRHNAARYGLRKGLEYIRDDNGIPDSDCN